MKQLAGFLIVIIGVMVLISSCKKEESNPTTASGAKTMTLNHWGVDFSQGITGSAANYWMKLRLMGTSLIGVSTQHPERTITDCCSLIVPQPINSISQQRAIWQVSPRLTQRNGMSTLTVQQLNLFRMIFG